MTAPDAGYLLFAIALAFVASDMWRWLGVALSDRIDENSAVFSWVRLVATALVAGLVAKLVMTPTGGLALAPLWLRLAAVACGMGAYRLGGRSLVLGISAGAGTLVAGMAVIG